MITSVHFTGVWISDSDRAYDFYVNKLGFKVVQDRPLGGGNRFLMVAPPGGGAALTVCKPMPGMDGLRIGGMTTIAFNCDDIQATYEDLAAKGVQFPKPPAQTPWGGMEATFLDPDKNAFMLHQLPR